MATSPGISFLESQLPRLIELRHDLHQIPELNYEEHKTADRVRRELDALELQYVAGVEGAPTATVALIGDQSRPCIALRADIDALPIVEQTGLPYASRHQGRMHACGHDGHTTILIGAAAVLQSIKNELPVCVKLLFQPAEESGAGAARLIDAGVLDGRIGPKVQAIFGLHGWPGLKVGMVATKAGALLAATDNFRATFIGRGCHGAYPQLGRDPIPAACEAVLSLQQIVSREMDPTEPAVVTVGTIEAGSAVNIIPGRASFSGTARTLGASARQSIESAISRRCQGIAAANGCELDLEWWPGYPATVNDPDMADFIRHVAVNAFGPDRFIPVARPSMGGEDFAFYLQRVPGCFFLIGVEPPDQLSYPSLHSDTYDFTDAAIQVGVRMFVEIANRYGKQAIPVARPD